jgi:glycosyltransferase involved in cell wall biosynthesis
MHVCVDGKVFENDYQIGIWRSLFEVMKRLDGRVAYSLLLGRPPLQAVPPGVRLARSFRRVAAADVFHTSYFAPRPSAAIPSVVTVHDMVAERFFWTCPHLNEQIVRKRAAVLSATICVAVSAATAADLKALIPEVADRIRIVHHGAEHLMESGQPCQRARSTNGADPFALFVGGRLAYKNFDTMLAALRDPAWPRTLRLHVVGEPFNDAERRLVEVQGLADRVRVFGRLSDEDLRNQYSHASCFVFPSLLEGFGIPVLEAQANGCPAVLSDIPAFREIGGEGALFFDPRLAECLAAAVAEACNSKTRERLADAGFENCRRFRWDRSAEQTAAIYEEAASAGVRVPQSQAEQSMIQSFLAPGRYFERQIRRMRKSLVSSIRGCL